MVKYKIVWDNGVNAGGEFRREFDSYDEAEAYGTDWANECNFQAFGTTEPTGPHYTYEIVKIEVEDPPTGEDLAAYEESFYYDELHRLPR